jgi:hypothetical protein
MYHFCNTGPQELIQAKIIPTQCSRSLYQEITSARYGKNGGGGGDTYARVIEQNEDNRGSSVSA